MEKEERTVENQIDQLLDEIFAALETCTQNCVRLLVISNVC